MADNLGSRVFLFQLDQQVVHSHDLFGSARILVLTILSDTTLVANADRLLVESLDMCSDLIFRAACNQLTVGADVIVISDITPPVAHYMASTQFLDGKVLLQFSRRTMNH